MFDLKPHCSTEPLQFQVLAVSKKKRQDSFVSNQFNIVTNEREREREKEREREMMVCIYGMLLDVCME